MSKKPITNAQKLSIKLGVKPCPFCGSEARLKQHYKLKNVWYVQCTNCGIRTPNSVQYPYQAWQEVKYLAVLDWNTRLGEDNNAEQTRLIKLCAEEITRDRSNKE